MLNKAQADSIRHNSETDPASITGPSRPVQIVVPSKGWTALDWGELWEYRDLLYFLVWRNLKVRYKQTILGAAWAIIQPFFTMIVFSIFFGKLAGIPSAGSPYPVFTFCALVPWTYFANAVSLSSNSLIDYETVITKVYFPRLFAPIASVITGLVDLAISFIVLLILIFFYGIHLTTAIWTLPFFVALAMLGALAVGLWLSALNVQYRDVRHAVPFLIQFWLFATPIAYSSQLVPDAWRAVYGLNPMAGVVEGFRWALLGQAAPSIPLLAASTLTTILAFVSGLYYFRRMERYFADII